MSVQSEINRITSNITAALTAVADKGVEVPEGANSDSLASLVASIEAAGGKALYGTYKPSTGVRNFTVTHNFGAVPNLIMYVSTAFTSARKYMGVVVNNEHYNVNGAIDSDDALTLSSVTGTLDITGAATTSSQGNYTVAQNATVDSVSVGSNVGGSTFNNNATIHYLVAVI